ncbi:50S ribosomal protein L37e [Candidatus Woesearchaeota archaeon]|nr:50S ribosomal protein L37e [Candidatus Woesearchaeota archaeon]
MTKGTYSQGKKSRGKTHIRCRRCGDITYHKKRKICSSCGYGKSARMKHYNWQKK